MEEFISWDMITTFSRLALIVFMVVEFVKEIAWIKEIKTKYLSWIVSFVLIVVSNLVLGTFVFVDVVLYALSSIVISLTANGLYDFNKKVTDERE